MQAREFQHLAQVLDDLQQPAVVGQFLYGAVKLLVGFEEAFLVAGSGVFLELCVDGIESGDIVGARLLRRLAGAASFKHGHQGENLVEVAFRNLGDVATAAWFQRHQAFGRQYFQGFAQRCAADAIVDGQRLLVDPGARRQFVRENALAKPFGDFLIERGLGDTGGTHG